MGCELPVQPSQIEFSGIGVELDGHRSSRASSKGPQLQPIADLNTKKILVRLGRLQPRHGGFDSPSTAAVPITGDASL